MPFGSPATVPSRPSFRHVRSCARRQGKSGRRRSSSGLRWPVDAVADQDDGPAADHLDITDHLDVAYAVREARPRREVAVVHETVAAGPERPAVARIGDRELLPLGERHASRTPTAPGRAVCRSFQARRLGGVDSPASHDIRPTRTRPASTGLLRQAPRNALPGLRTTGPRHDDVRQHQIDGAHRAGRRYRAPPGRTWPAALGSRVPRGPRTRTRARLPRPRSPTGSRFRLGAPPRSPTSLPDSVPGSASTSSRGR